MEIGQQLLGLQFSTVGTSCLALWLRERVPVYTWLRQALGYCPVLLSLRVLFSHKAIMVFTVLVTEAKRLTL